MMLDQPTNPDDEIAKVSISARLIPLISYSIAAIGGGVGGLFLRNAINALRQNENAGIGAVTGALMESNLPVIAALSFAAIIGLAGIIIAVARLFMSVTKASPPVWFFIVPGLLGLLPVIFFFAAETVMLNAILPRTMPSDGGVAAAASTISTLYTLAMATAIIVPFLMLAPALIPISSRKSKKLGSLFFLLLFETAIIAAIAILINRLMVLNKINYDLGMMINAIFVS